MSEMTKLIIPEKINVGFQKRTDTYSGFLAFVVYTDAKGNMKKEKSWNGWRDKKIPQKDFSNVPTSGFVLNQDAGGKRHSWSSWDTRMEKVRVFDPRGFEIEITIPNLLFILQECSSIKGKGIEGELIYGWDKQELILLPACCPEYVQSQDHTSLQTKKVTAKDIVEGGVYKMKDHSIVMYLGRHTWFNESSYPAVFGKKVHVFAYLDRQTRNGRMETKIGDKYHYCLESGFTNIAETAEIPDGVFALEYDGLTKTKFIHNPVSFKVSSRIVRDKYFHDRDCCFELNGKVYIGEIRNDNNYYVSYNDHTNDLLKFEITAEFTPLVEKGEFRKVKLPEEIKTTCLGKDLKILDLYVECDDGTTQKR